MCTALLVKHVNKIAHLLALATPPLVFLAVTSQGPKVSTPTYVNGGDGLHRKSGIFPIFCVSSLRRNFLQITHEFNNDEISLLAPITQ